MSFQKEKFDNADRVARHSRPLPTKDLLNESFDFDALEHYRESVAAQNLNSSTYNALTETEENDILKNWSLARTRAWCIKQECTLAQQLLKKIRLEQERRDKFLKLQLENADRKRKWNEFDIQVASELRFVKSCQDKEISERAAFINQLAEAEKEYRQRLRLPFFVDLFFDIDEELFPELDEDALKLVRYAWDSQKPESEIFCEEFGIPIKRHDLKTLQGLNWLNDEVINFYLSLIARRSNERLTLPKTYSFNTFFLATLQSRGYAAVRRWTRKVDIFAYDILLFPVHLGNHWCLIAVDLKAQDISYFDSLGGTNYGCLEVLKNYLEEEHKDKRKLPIDLSNWTLECRKDIPRQMNGSDCGVFTCCFAEFSSRRCDLKFDQRIMPYYRQRMVYEICEKRLMI